MTREELIARLIEAKTRSKSYVWGQVVSAISSIPINKREDFVNAVNGNDALSVGKQVIFYINSSKKEEATTEVTDIVSDDQLTLDEVLELLE